ncbi:MAG TPA: MarR family winged helix-turn-helix transcriptional regulator [Casimicrobiaceae bacterium]|nr:MarR family winged helix-turn-helix transcriptional regulator [Casimicrobiaceae bacterium]
MKPSRHDAPSGAAGSLQGACACGRLRRATRALTQLYDDAMAPAGLRVTQFSVLRTLARDGSTRISDLASQQLLDRTAMSRHLDPLVKRGLVSIGRGSDGRTREVAITAGGMRELHDAEPYWKKAQREVERTLGNRKLTALIAMLHELEALHPDLAAPRASSEAKPEPSRRTRRATIA